MKKHFFIIVIGLLGFQIQAYSQVSEYTVKAAFLEKFTRFVEWPADSDLDDTSQIFIISVIGDNPFNDNLDKLFSYQKIKSKKVQIRYISNIDDIGYSHLLFISNSKEKSLTQILDYTKNKPILTIGDTPGYSEKGVLINLFLIGDRVRFEINETAVQRSGLHISYLLLNLAKIVAPIGRG